MPATIKDVANLAGVSTATVSYVISGARPVSKKARERVNQAMQELRYFPSAVARSLRVRRSRTIGLIVPRLDNLYFTEAAHGIEEVLQKNGYSLIISESRDNPQAENNLIQVYNSLLVDGLIMVPCGPQQCKLRSILRGSYPTVFLDRRPTGFSGDSVTLDNFEATYEAISMLLRAGHVKIGMVLGATWYSTTKDRLRGYRQAYKDMGVKIPPRLVRHGDYGLESGLEICGKLYREDGVTAIFAASGSMTLGAFLKAKEMGLSIPGQIAILGCDDLSWASATEPSLSMIFQPSYEMGRKTAELLLRRIAEPADQFETIHLSTTLRLRGST